jgi:alkylation response protein AidB-like acyl-CoA dehydrogenase
VNFSPGEDAESLRALVRGFLDKQSTEQDVRYVMNTDTGYDADVWARAAQELGLHGLAVPEEFGGSGAGPVELGVVFEEMGAALYGGPFLSTIALAGSALQQIGDPDATADYLPGIAAGTTTATLAWAGAAPSQSTLTAERSAGGWRISGRAPIVVDGASAELILVAATTAAGRSLFAVHGADTGVTRTQLTAMDSTRRLATLGFADVPARLLGIDGQATQPLRRTLDLAALYLAAEQLGGADRVLAMAVEYAKTRVQFGRPIGSFQAIKHRLADMLVDVESTRSVVQHGLWTAAHEPENLHVAASLARTIAADAYQVVAANNVQIHGGIGFTWEHPAHLYLKRAKSSQLLLGSPTQHRARLARLIGLTAVAESPNATSDTTPGTSPDAAVLDDELTRFLRDHPVPDPADVGADRAFREARFDAGLAVVSLAEGHGGRGLDSSLQTVVEQRMIREGAADHTGRNVVGLGMTLPTIHAHGTEAQKTRHLRPCFSGAEIWCQLFSEPGAGSDLAGLATRAVLDGDHYVVDGQKVWTSLGHVAHWGILLARTDPDVPKHLGLTYFLLDMRTPGVEVRPLRQLTGEAEFNEVYFTGVRVPVANVLGEVGDGWRVAMTTLSNERISIGARPTERGSGPIAQLIEVFRGAQAAGRLEAAASEQVMLLWTRAEAARLTNARAAAQIGRRAGPEGSIAKLQMAEINKAIYELCVDLSGNDGLLIDDYAETAPAVSAVHGSTDVRKAWLRSLANSLEGGTSEILRNVVGERVLGLPGEPRVDRGVAWKDTRRA